MQNCLPFSFEAIGAHPLSAPALLFVAALCRLKKDVLQMPEAYGEPHPISRCERLVRRISEADCNLFLLAKSVGRNYGQQYIVC